MSKIAILFLSCAVIASVSAGRVARQLGAVGAPSEISLPDAEKRVTETFKLISAGEGNPKLELVKIHSATHQVVAGSKYDIELDLKEGDEVKEKCKLVIIEQSWLEKKDGDQGGVSEITCPGGHNKSYKHKVAQ